MDGARAALIKSRGGGRSLDPSLLVAAIQEATEQARKALKAVPEEADEWELSDALLKACVVPEEIEASRRARRATESAAFCGQCGHSIGEEGRLYLGVDVYTGISVPSAYSGYVSESAILRPRFEKTVVCEDCAPRDLVEKRDLSDERYVYVDRPCDGCGRPIVRRIHRGHYHRFHHFCCCQRCGEIHRNRLRKEERARSCEKVCEVCGRPFLAIRADAKTCSRACKQKAYRARKKGS